MDDRETIIEAWKQTVAVQMHFNDLALRIRSFALTLIAAILAVGFTQGNTDYPIPIAAASLLVWPSFWLVDRFWYHPLLIGAVNHGMAIENQAKKLGLTLSGFDSDKSNYSLLGLANRISVHSREALKMKTKRKMDLYYFIIFVALLAIVIAQLIYQRSSTTLNCKSQGPPGQSASLRF